MKKIALLSVICFLCFSFSCKKKPSAGLGGNANLKITAKHHGLVIDSCAISIKFNASDAPANGEYDFVQKTVTINVGNSYAIIQGLKKGDYYILGEGWDPSINQRVKGGIPYTIDSETDLSIDLPVTED